MLISDPKFLYLILILPAVFGITLIGEGLNKLLHQDTSGIISFLFGGIFIAIVVLSYFFFSNYLAK